MSGDATTSRAWDRQPDEPNNWYARFERFRLAGPNRSVLAVYNAERKAAGKSGAKSNPRPWDDAARAWRWRERAEDFDESERARRRSDDEARYRQELEEHRTHCRTLAAAELTMAAKLLTLVEKRLGTLKADELAAANLPNCLRAIAAITEAGLSAESQTLAVDHVMRQLLDAERADPVA